jgi:hypothetical protein
MQVDPLELARWILNPMTCNVDERHRAVAEALIRREEGVAPHDAWPRGPVCGVCGKRVKRGWYYCTAEGCGTRLKWPKEEPCRA